MGKKYKFSLTKIGRFGSKKLQETTIEDVMDARKNSEWAVRAERKIIRTYEFDMALICIRL